MTRGGTAKATTGPVRSCLGCRTAKGKAELCRLALAPGGVVLDRRQALPGRGAYVCLAESCVRVAARQLPRALKVPGLSLDGDALWRIVTGQPEPIVYDPDAPPVLPEMVAGGPDAPVPTKD